MNKNKKNNYIWILKITLITFFISMVFSFTSETILNKTNIFIGIFILILFIIIGIVFDMIGVSITSVDEKPIHSMNSKKVKGAKVALFFIKNADKMSSFCNDVVGDICGIMSGSAGIIIANTISIKFNIDYMIVALLITSLIAAFTIGGKALGKGIALKNNTLIVFWFSKFVSIFYNK